MKKLLALTAVAMLLAACGTVTVKEGNKECSTMTIGLFGASIGGPLSSMTGCK